MLDLDKQKTVKHSTDPPPVWDELHKRYGVSWERTAVAYGDTIHAMHPLPADVEVHERVHLHQQGYTEDGARAWWVKYLADPQFRYEQELEAYQAQYKFLKKTIKDRNALAKKLDRLADHLSGEMYGKLVTKSEALTKIKN